MLFADLVGFTALSENRDAEEVRDLLSRYFDLCRQIVGRYGGTVEKFIGDAVMSVWGTPVAQENDAERAVRAGLELASGVAAMGDEVGAPELRARVGVLTGEAAVTLGAEGQGVVAGDLVNTASRIQSVAEPGDVLVGDITRRATEAAIAYDDAGTHELKGKEEPVQLWRTTRVVGTLKGLLRARGLEAPFVGRDREMRLVKGLFHARADEGKAHLVSVVGVAGVGKTRLSWEYERYIDGLAGTVWWHRGRCLAYGEGVAYWALADMVRGRGIVEGEGPATTLPKVRAMVEQYIVDPEERKWVGGAPADSSPWPGRAERTGQVRPVLGVAAVLRAPGRSGPRGPGVRGPPVGRQRARRLHRVPVGVVQGPPAVHPHAVPARDHRPPAHLGSREAQLHLAVPGAALRRGHE
ncbi:MAG: adenylate/guanylate cyclase domain-containing protein [Actinomycetota bacterium]